MSKVDKLVEDLMGLKEKANALTAKRDFYMKRLNDMGLGSIEEAEQKIEELKETKTKLERRLERLVSELEEVVEKYRGF